MRVQTIAFVCLIAISPGDTFLVNRGGSDEIQRNLNHKRPTVEKLGAARAVVCQGLQAFWR